MGKKTNNAPKIWVKGVVESFPDGRMATCQFV